MATETASSKIDRAALLTRKTAEELYTKLRKGQYKPETPLQPEEMADVLINVLSNFPLKDRSVRKQLWIAFADLFENLMVDTANAGTADHDE